MTTLQTKDPTLAVVIERLNNLNDKLDDIRKETREGLSSQRAEFKEEIATAKKEFAAEISEMRSAIRPVTELLTRAKGGYMVVLGLGALLAYMSGVWDKVAKLFASGPHL